MAAWISFPGLARFVFLMERYGDAIEADLQRIYRVDVLDVFRGRLTVRKALNFIDRCPPSAEWKAEYAQDDELAARHAAYDDGEVGRDAGVPLTQWTPLVELATLQCELIGHLIAVTSAAHSKDGTVHAPPPLPRPVRALDRLEKVLQEDAFQSLLRNIEQAQAAGEAAAAEEPDAERPLEISI